MSVRAVIESKPKLILGALGVVVLVAIGWAATSLVQPRPVEETALAYYTVDDGKTLFTAPPDRIVPFEKEGKQAVRAHVYKCGGKDTTLYLSRYTETAKRAIEGGGTVPVVRGAPIQNGQPVDVSLAGQEFKRVGETAWIAGPPAAIMEVRSGKCPDGSVGVLVSK